MNRTAAIAAAISGWTAGVNMVLAIEYGWSLVVPALISAGATAYSLHLVRDQQ